MNTRDIAVVGMACVFPRAADRDAYWYNIVNGVDAVGELPPDRWPGARNTALPDEHFARVHFTRGGFIPTPFHFDALRYKVMPRVAQHGDVDQFILTHVIDRALADAGIEDGDRRRERTDVVLGRGGYTSNKMMEIFLRADLVDRLDRWLEGRVEPAARQALRRDILETLPDLDVDGMASSIPNFAVSRAANRLDLRGAAYTVDAACASSLVAVEQVLARLRDGRCEVGVACGVNFTHVPSFWYLFDRILAVSPSGCIRPFDANADGMLIGEGAGAVVLKRATDALSDGDAVYALIKGAGSAGDGGATGILAPSSRGQIAALAAAYDDADLEPSTVGMIEAHGTGTVQGDAAEIETLQHFWPRAGGHPTRALGSVKSMIGHTMPAAGIAALIKTALALSNRILPPSLHCETPHPSLAATDFFVNTRARPWSHDLGAPPRRAAINAFGFGGINGHVVLEEAAPSRAPGEPTSSAAVVVPAAMPPDAIDAVDVQMRQREPLPQLIRPAELLIFTGNEDRDLVAGLRRAAGFLRADRQDPTLEDLAYTLVQEADLEATHRLALVMEADEDVAARLDEVAGRLEGGGLDTDELAGLYLGRDVGRFSGKVAALFPGQGFPGLVGHYPEHLMSFCMHLPRVRRIIDRVEGRDHHPEDPLPTSYLLMPPDHLPDDERVRLRSRFGTNTPLAGVDPDGPPPLPHERGLSAMGMLVSNWVSWLVLEAFDIPFEMVCGQSLGDFTALCAAGMVDFEEIIPRLWPYLSVDDRLPGVGCLAFVGADEALLAPLLAEAGEVTIALHLSPETQIVGGTDDAVDALVTALKQRNVMAQKLPFPPVHTPRLTELQHRLQEMEGDPVPLQPARRTVYSTITESPMPDDIGELRSLVAGNISRPVRFWQTVRRMYEDGGRIFIQVGTGTLAGNIRAILPYDDAVAVALDVDYRHPLTQLQHLCGTLLTRGVAIDPTALFEARAPRHLPLDSPREEKAAVGVPLTLYWPPLHAPAGKTAGAGRVPAGAAGSGTTAPPPVEAVSPPSNSSAATPSPLTAETARAGAAAASIPGTMPLVGEVQRYEAGRSIVTERTFDLDEDLFLANHTFLHGDGVKPLEERFPLLPLTMTLEMMAEVAACLAPGRGVIGLENVRARQWIALDGVQRLAVRNEGRVESDADGVMRVRVDVHVGETGVASATVCLSERYRLDLHLQFAALNDPRLLGMEPRRLYEDRYYFHGPMFRCVESVDSVSDRGVTGELTTLERPAMFASNPDPQLLLDPVTLDGAGQMFGTIFLGQELYMLPVSIDALELYRPTPAGGTRVPIRVEVTEFDRDARRVACNMEVQDGAGRVWFRIKGWRDVLFRWRRDLLETQRLPRLNTLAHPVAAGCVPGRGTAVLLRRETLRDAQIERLARLYLDAREWPMFQATAGSYRRQREWLMGRIAAKDAVRLHLGPDEDGLLLHPSSIVIDNDAAGRPLARRLDGGSLPPISLAHVQAGAAAIAGPEPVGIDLEVVGAGQDLELDSFTGEAERRRLDAAGWLAEADAVTRLWCAKEAAAKTTGRGLQGRPRAIEVVRVESDGTLVMRHDEPPGWTAVRSRVEDGRVLAVAVRRAAVADAVGGEAS